ncbi:MAG: diguanylate cyclase, partial [Desulfovibrionaceae bacterium]
MTSTERTTPPVSPLKRRSFTRDLTLSLVVLITVVVGVLFSVGYYDQHRQFQAELEESAYKYASEMARILVVPVWTFDNASVEQVCSVFYQNELVYALRVEDMRGGVLADLARKRDESPKITQEADILFEGLPIGRVHLTLTSLPLEREMNRLLLSTGLTGLAVLVVLAVATGLLLRIFVKRPLLQLMRGMDRVARGEFDHGFAHPTHKEIGEISERFSHMVNEVHQREEVLAGEVAERKRAEERYALAVRGANDGIWDWDLINDEMYYSPRWKEIIGFRRDEFPNDIEEWKKRIHPDDRRHVVDSHMNYMAGIEDSLDLEYRLRHRDGTYRWVHARGASLQDETGECVRISGAITDITRRKRAQLALREREEHYRAMVEAFDGFIYICDQERTLQFMNSRLMERVGRDATGEKCHMAIHGLITPCPWCPADIVFRGETRRAEERNPRDGRWYYTVSTPIFNPDGTMALQSMIQDVTERKLAEEEVLRSESQYRTLIETTSEGYVMLDKEGVITAVNPSFSEMLGYVEEDLVGSELLDFMDAENRELVRAQMAKWETTNHRNYEFSLQRSDGGSVIVIASSTSMRDKSGRLTGAFALFMDITERKRMETQLRHQAMHDPLTGLANRTLCNDRVAHALERARRRREYHYAVIFVDLDRFKLINDNLGHAVGDQLLREVALRLGECTRELDTLARIGGDEFVILLEEMDSPRKAVQVVKRMREALRKPISLTGNEVQVTSSMGIVLGPNEYETAEEVLRYANIAMHRAKAKGRDRFKVFSNKLLDHAVQMMTLEADMDNALALGEFSLRYQPIVRVRGGQRLYGFEALVRWNHPTRGEVPPAHFIPVAEESGLITDLGLWVLYEASRTMARWQAHHPGAEDLFLSVNVSARQFSQADLAGKIKRILDMSRM